MAKTNAMQMKRPLGVTILALLGIFGVLVSLLQLTSGKSVLFGQTFIGGVSYILILIVMAANAYIAYGFLKGIKLSWWIAIVFFILGLINNIIALVSVGPTINAINQANTGNGYNSTVTVAAANLAGGLVQLTFTVGLLLGLVYIFYLTRPRIKNWFRF